MKKRNLTFGIFMLCAVLVMGIGFAAVSGVLNLSGTAKFSGKDATSTAITSAVKFTKAEADGKFCTTASLGDTGMNATMAVTVNETRETVPAGETYTATATFTIKYDTTDKTLPHVQFDDPASKISTSGTVENFQVTTDWAGQTKTLAPGDETTITVTITFTQPETIVTTTQSMSFTIPLNYTTVGEKVEEASA